jgi:hypothetical protein
MGRNRAFKELLEPKDRNREFSLSVDAETYARVTEVSKLTGKSRPKVLRSFVDMAYAEFKKVCGNGEDK